MESHDSTHSERALHLQEDVAMQELEVNGLQNWYVVHYITNQYFLLESSDYVTTMKIFFNKL